MARQALRLGRIRTWRHRLRAARARGHACACSVPRSLRAVRGGRVPDAVGQVRAVRARRSRARASTRSPATSRRARTSRRNPELARRYPLAFISPPAHHFLNSTFSAQPVFVRRESEPIAHHPSRRRRRARHRGRPIACAPSTTAARSWRGRDVSDAARPGVVVGLSIWWAKMCPGGRNANAVTGQELTDMGGGATFYDCLVEVDAA